jgi:hypothetical protein
MSVVHLPAVSFATAHSADVDSDSESAGTDDDQGWDDWVSDPTQSQPPSKSLFDEQSFKTVAEALGYDKETHGFDFLTICSSLCQCRHLEHPLTRLLTCPQLLYKALDVHQRIRLINFVRKTVRLFYFKLYKRAVLNYLRWRRTQPRLA